MSGDVTPEEAVRQYLLYLTDPDSLRDEAAIKEAEEAVAETADPIAKVRAVVALERLQSLDHETLRQNFIEHAKEWAETEGVTGSALQTVGVPRDDLEAAGIIQPARRAGRGRSEQQPRSRAPRLSLDEVATKLPGQEFRLADLAAAIDRELPTTRNYLNKLVEQGVVEEIGTDPSHDGRGAAPKLYVRA